MPGDRGRCIIDRRAGNQRVGAAVRDARSANRYRSDYGPEFRGRVMDEWAYAGGVRLQFIQPGKPVQNAFIESFNSRLRDE
jgi:putative transposase